MRQVPQALQVVAAVVLSNAASSKKIKTLCRRSLVKSIKELADTQRQLVLDCAEDRHHERQLEQQRQELQGAQQTREWHLRRRAELTDLARKYRKLDAELDVNDENSRRLSEFYVQEGRLLQEEIRQLDRRSSGGESTSNDRA